MRVNDSQKTELLLSKVSESCESIGKELKKLKETVEELERLQLSELEFISRFTIQTHGLTSMEEPITGLGNRARAFLGENFPEKNAVLIDTIIETVYYNSQRGFDRIEFYSIIKDLDLTASKWSKEEIQEKDFETVKSILRNAVNYFVEQKYLNTGMADKLFNAIIETAMTDLTKNPSLVVAETLKEICKHLGYDRNFYHELRMKIADDRYVADYAEDYDIVTRIDVEKYFLNVKNAIIPFEKIETKKEFYDIVRELESPEISKERILEIISTAKTFLADTGALRYSLAKMYDEAINDYAEVMEKITAVSYPETAKKMVHDLYIPLGLNKEFFSSLESEKETQEEKE